MIRRLCGVLVMIGCMGWPGLALRSVAQDTPAEDTILEAVIAQVNDEFILLSELQRIESQIRRQILQQTLPEQRETRLREIQAKLIDQMIDQRLLVQKAREYGFDPEPYVQDTIERIRRENNITSDAQFEQILAREGLTYEQFVQSLRNQILAQQVVVHYVQPRIVITEREIQEYYTRHPDDFRQPERWQFYQIRIPSDPETRARVETWITGGAAPETLEPRLNDIADAQLTLVGPIDPGQLREDVRSVLEDAPPGTWRGPIVREDQILWVWLVEKTGGDIPSLEQVRDRIYERLWQQKSQELRKQLLAELRKHAYIRIYTENLPEPYRSLYQNVTASANPTTETPNAHP